MRFTRLRIRTLLVAVASAATGCAAATRYIRYIVYPDIVLGLAESYYTETIVTTAAVIGVGTHVALLGVLALLPRMTTRWWMVAVAIVAALLAVKVHLSRVADQYRAIAKQHQSQSFAVSSGKQWDGSSPDGRWSIHIGTTEPNAEELKGRELALFLWHYKLSHKYEDAALCPWFPVPPDPPEPN
jgi:hypothetical protein